MKRKHESTEENLQQTIQQPSSGNSSSGTIDNNVTDSNSSNDNVQPSSSESNNFENQDSSNNTSNVANSSCSGSSINGNNTQRIQQKRVCREFVKGLCRRIQCRFPHVLTSDQVIFCHDFQNTSCTRGNCRFLHYTLEEEEYYLRNGEFPTEKSNEFSRPLPLKMLPGEGNSFGYDRSLSLCYKRSCLNDRSSRRHSPNSIGHTHHRTNLRNTSPLRQTNLTSWNDFHNRHSLRFNNHCNNLPSNSEYRSGYNNDFQFGSSYMPQQPTRNSQPNSFQRSQQNIKGRMQQSQQHDSNECILRQRSLEEVVNMLRCRIEVAELTVAEVRATNEYLLTQMRLNKIQQQCTQCSSTVVVNPVTVTQTTSQPQTAQVIGAVSMAPVQVQATPIVSIATPQTQIITNNSATPLAIATNTSQGQQLAIAQQNITSLSNTTQPLSGTHAQQILGTSQITLAPAIGNGTSMGLTINTSQALAMSNATQPIISYPVMTHSILPH